MLMVVTTEKQRAVRAVLCSRMVMGGFVISVMVSFSALLLHAQEIDIRVLNSRNGKPVTNECLNISLGSWHGGDLIAPTNRDGVVVLHLENNQMTATTTPHACNGMAVPGPKAVPSGVDIITIAPDQYVGCQEYGRVAPGEPATPNLRKQIIPSYSIRKILESGISAPNTCGKFRTEARPGELVFYVRPRSFLEKMRQ